MNNMNMEKVELVGEYPYPPDVVWRALTDSSAVTKWLMLTDFKPLIGFRFRMEQGETKIRGKVIEVVEGSLLAYLWDDEEDGESVVCWTLDPIDGGTRLRLEHRRVEAPVVTSLPVATYFNWSYALRHGLPGLLRLLEAGQPQPPMFLLQEVAK